LGCKQCFRPCDQALRTALQKAREMRQAWQHACKLILNREPVEAITRQLSLALFMDAALDLKGARPQQRRRGA